MQRAILLAATLLTACASAPPRPPRTPGPPPSIDEAAPAAKRAIPAGQIRREDVLAVLSDGPPAFLSRVDVEPMRDRGGRFQGWKVVSIKEADWAEGDVRPGDLVTRVNGRRIENPFEFFEVFQSLAFATELRLTVEREGAPRELRYPINDDPSAPPVPRPEKAADASDPRNGDSPPPPKEKAARRGKKLRDAQ